MKNIDLKFLGGKDVSVVVKKADELFNEFSFRKIGYADYGDWDELSSIVGEEEVKKLRKIYFDCEDYVETTWVVLLYHNLTYVTLVRD